MISSLAAKTLVNEPVSGRYTTHNRLNNFRGPTFVGLAAVAFSAGGLLTWSCTTSIASATVVPGIVVVDTGRKYVEHLLGGTVKTIQVREGQKVVAGQILAKLDTASYDVSIDSLQTLLASNTGQQIRLDCERVGCASLSFPDHVELVDDAHWREAETRQQRMFVAQTASLQNRIETAQADETRSNSVSRSITAEIAAQQTKLSLTRQELRIAMTLAHEGNGTQQRVIEVARVVAELQGELAALQVQEINTQHDIMHEQLEITQFTSAFSESAQIDLQQADREHAELVGKLRTEIQERSACSITAPVAGRVVDLMIHTIGGVVAPGASVLEIVPNRDELVLDAKVNPSDIESISPGLVTDIRLPGMIGQRMPRLTGHVTDVSADRLEDQQDGHGFFRVRVGISQADRERMGSYELKAGAEVTLMIRKGEQAPLSYLVAPLAAFFGQSWS